MQASVKRENGALKVEIDGRLYAPLSFKSFRPNPKNISEFYRVGVRLFSVLSSGIISALGVPYSLFGESWIDDDTYDFSVIDRQLDMFIENAPEGYFAPMLQVDTRPWYIQKHGVPNSFTNLSQVAWDEEWRRAAADYLKAAIRHCEEKYGNRIYGYFILGGMTTEWLAHPDEEASHPIKEAGYRRWSMDDSAVLPTQAALSRRGDVFLNGDEGNVLRARRFHAETVSDLVLYFAHEVQGVLCHKKLLGCYYGYLLHLGGEFLFNSGHLAYEKVFLSPDIDMISSPSDYRYRAFTDPSAFMLTQKTLDAHNKLYFLEFDHITHVAPTMIDDPASGGSVNKRLTKIPGADNKCKTPEESLNLMWRDFLLCYANGAALWWFDMFDGWFRSEEMMGAIRQMISLYHTLGETSKESAAEIAVYAEGESMYHVRKNSDLATVTLCAMQRTLAEMGAPYDLCSVADLDLCDPAKYRLVILLNAYDIPSERMERIRALQGAGVTVLWIYAPDYARGERNSAEQISAAVGMRVSIGKTGHGGLLCHGRVTPYTLAAPYFSVTDESALPLARFEDGAVAVAASRDEGSIYAAVPYLPSALLRDILRRKGIFLYSEDPLVYTYVNRGAIGVYNATGAPARLHVKEDGEYTDRITGDRFRAENGILTLPKRTPNAFLLTKTPDRKIPVGA